MRTPRRRSSPGAASGPRRNCCATVTESSPPASATPAGRTTTRPRTITRVTPRRSRSSSTPHRPPIGRSSSSFFQIHRADLGAGVVGSDYRSEIFCTSDEQRQVAEGTIADADAAGLWPGKVVTKISASGFWEAEAEDQDYLQHYPDGKNQFRP